MVMKCVCVSIVLLAATTVAFGQTTFNDLDAMTPVGLQPGSPAGSYALSGLDTINLYNGSNSITIPLLKIKSGSPFLSRSAYSNSANASSNNLF